MPRKIHISVIEMVANITKYLLILQELLIRGLMNNSIWKKRLNISKGLSTEDQNVACLLVHALITFLHLPDTQSLIQPLKDIAVNPQKMEVSTKCINNQMGLDFSIFSIFYFVLLATIGKVHI